MLFDIARDVFAAIGGVGLLVLLAWLKNPHSVEVIVAQIARLFAFFGSGVKRFIIKREVQGRINSHIESLDRWSDGVTPQGISIEWVRPGTGRESFLRGDSIVCRMDYSENPHLNYLNAALLCVQSGFLIEGRRYLTSTTRKAVDLTVVGLMLGKTGERGVAQTYYERVLPAELEQDSSVQSRYEEIQHIEQHGLFTNVFLPEVVSYHVNSGAAPPRSGHRQELERFIMFLNDLAKAADVRNSDANLDFNSQHIQVSIIYVGKREKLTKLGYDPYINMIRICKERGAHTIYVMATGASRHSLSNICAEAAQEGLCRVLDHHDFRRKIPENGRWMLARVVRLLVTE